MRAKVTKRKSGPPATGQTPMIGLRLAPHITARVDDFASKHGHQTRSDAIRHLIERGLSEDTGGQLRSMEQTLQSVHAMMSGIQRSLDRCKAESQGAT